MINLICIVCPKGCRLCVDEGNGCRVTGNQCPRGESYGRSEVLHPERILTSTVRVSGGIHRRCPVKTDGPIPKDKIFDAMRLLDSVDLTHPVREGQVILSDILGTGVSFVATRDI